jgi:hypothetical protein
MKSLSTILAAALVAGSCTVALAQGAGGSGGADSTQQGTMKDADKNPTGPGANPTAGNTGAAGNTGTAPMTSGQAGTAAPSGMTTAPASNTRSDSPQRPAGAKDNTGAATGQGGTK